MRTIDLRQANRYLKTKQPVDIVVWALLRSLRPIVTTNFRPYEAAILQLCAKVQKDILVIWCDTGYNTPATYKHAGELIKKLNLNVDIYVPKQTAAYRDTILGIPEIDHPNHKTFTEQVKLEPFRRAMKDHKPDLWFTNIRKGQTSHRDELDILSLTAEGILKVSPFYYWSDQALDDYLKNEELPNEFDYFDPTKVLTNRECGLHS